MTSPELPRQDCAAVVGGPTAILDVGGLRIVSDPTFDPPGPHGYLTKTAGPAVTQDQIGPVDLVLVSHDNHADNLDDSGRALALAAPLLLTTTSGSGRLGHPAVGLPPWTSHTVERPDGGELTVTAVPAVVIPAHYDGWAHFCEGRDDLVRAFDDAGVSARLRLGDHGTWVPLRT